MSEIGAPAAQELATILADIQAVETVDDLCALRGPQMHDPELGAKSLILKSGYTLTFCSAHPPKKGTKSLETDWADVTRIRIQTIEPDDE